MSNIASNLKYLRKKKGLTQQQFAEALEIKRASVGAYEEDRAEPKYELLKKIAEFYELSMDELANDEINEKWKPTPRSNASNLRVLSVTVDGNDRENIELVPVKASAGYLNGYGDPEYVAELPKFSLPMFNQGSYRAFEIKGDSMLPLPSGSIIIGEYVENWHDIKAGQTYIIVSKEDGVVYKRVAFKFKEDKGLKLVSDNRNYDPYWVESNDIIEVWKAKAYISTEMPEPNPEPTMETLTAMMSQMQKTINSVVDNK
ncbi:XRE family transcriptional regulator [Sphingobacterium psychroaquaticum]|uniref:DNA-binding transcriptional regulator, XRE-family HTH domain n=1 Tax=Sphingobacterium psychroaquaticum TaxID=561061 RepID=A0A1X7IHD6_9SPHI|nr:helix-turn-helix domain-containing protein [Sphingobacterium psychroaquaticum]QBQ41512.1 helix-turn-helix domain-containing protein [Sphingobacterium psychroaquaticum]SMG14263.1 DNA-binding transcriptional regulator, XRE-family HTH domain [Sphingobacterium psychroaquaticum]